VLFVCGHVWSLNICLVFLWWRDGLMHCCEGKVNNQSSGKKGHFAEVALEKKPYVSNKTNRKLM
jgi:hypothetical protein